MRWRPPPTPIGNDFFCCVWARPAQAICVSGLFKEGLLSLEDKNRSAKQDIPPTPIRKSELITLIIWFIVFRMPKAWRKCSLCPVDSYNRTDLVIFSTQALASLCTTYVCELHYQPDDMKEHGDSKRYSLHTCKLTWFDLCVHISDLSLGLPRLYLLLPMQTTSTPGMATQQRCANVFSSLLDYID